MSSRKSWFNHDSEAVFFLKDTSPRKPNRWLVLPRIHGKGGHPFFEMTADQRTALWTAAIAKGNRRAEAAPARIACFLLLP